MDFKQIKTEKYKNIITETLVIGMSLNEWTHDEKWQKYELKYTLQDQGRTCVSQKIMRMSLSLSVCVCSINKLYKHF